METKKCSNCGKFMIKWDSNVIIVTMPPLKQMAWACACGHIEDCDPEPLVTTPDNGFIERWKKANGE